MRMFLSEKDGLAINGKVDLVVKKALNCTKIPGVPDTENLRCKVITNNSEFIFGVVHHPPS